MAWDDIPDWSIDVAQRLLAEVKIKDPFTFYHCCRVGRGSRKLAKALGLNEFEQALLEFSGLFHDIGKARIPSQVLVKPGRLEKGEIEIMKSHAALSVEMVQEFTGTPFFRFMIPGIRYHHERIDGAGYPYGMKGDDIPIAARLIAVVDSYDAMTNARPYRNPLPEEKAIGELVAFSGTQFDAQMVKAFLEILPQIKKQEGKEEKDEIVVAQLIKAA